MTGISRRELLKRVGSTGAAAGLSAAGLMARATPDSALPRAAQGARAEPIQIAGQHASLVIAPASAVTSRITITADRDASTALRSDGSLVERHWPAAAARLRELTRPRTVACGEQRVRVSWSDAKNHALQIEVSGRDGQAIQRLRVDRETGALSFRLSGRPLLGLGEGGPQFDRRGSIVGSRAGQGAYRLRTHGARVPVQWLIDTGGSAMFVHQPYGAFDLTGDEGRFTTSDPQHGAPAAASLPLDVFVVGTRDPQAMMREYAALTGHPDLPPLWSFGYQQSHRTLASRGELLEEANTFREKKLPCDTLIYLGTGFCPSGWNTDNGEFTFNPKVFPDPGTQIQELHDAHFKVVLHVVLEAKTLTGSVADACTAPPLPTGRTADGVWPDHRQVSCYWPAHKPLFDVGVDGWWPDQGDGLDAPSRRARNRMYADGSRLWRPNQRVFALHRNGHAGMQREGAFLWSGDVFSTWETLKTHVPIGINTALSGIPFW
ncbi:MAG: TIM-barrel domain-containing protein, partial [Vicinamibacterales bacterium]